MINYRYFEQSLLTWSKSAEGWSANEITYSMWKLIKFFCDDALHMCTLSSTGREIEICFTGFRSPNLSVSSIYFCFTCSALFAGIWSHLFKTNDVHWVNNFSFIFLYFCRLLASLDKIKRSCFRIMKRKSKCKIRSLSYPKQKCILTQEKLRHTLRLFHLE